jgi:putative ABC transport system ATP-binding protein
MVFQNYALFPHMSVARNVAYPLSMRRMGKAEIAKRVAEALEMVELAGMAERLPKQLSGGQQQRVAVARALVSNPKVILADEPTGNLDTANGNAVMELLINVARAGTTVIMVTHSLSYAALANRTIKLLDGRIVSETLLAA